MSEGGGREGTGQVGQDLVGRREDLGFYPEGGGIPGGLWAEEGWGLTQVLMSYFWPLLGKDCGEGGWELGTRVEGTVLVQVVMLGLGLGWRQEEGEMQSRF